MKCKRCDGTGQQDNPPGKCRVCEGAGRIGPTEAEVDEIMQEMEKAAAEYGVWYMVCAFCSRTCGMKIAKGGKPTEEEVSRIMCEDCDTVGQVLLEFEK